MSHVIHKEFGNDAYLKQEYGEAIDHYTLAIGTARAVMFDSERDPNIEEKLASYYSNRAAAHTMLKQYDEALADCDAAVNVDPTFSKAYLRKAKLQLSKGSFEEALKTNEKAAEHDPGNSRLGFERNTIDATKLKFDKATRTVVKLRACEPLENANILQETFDNIQSVLQYCTACPELKVLQAEILHALGQNDKAYELSNTLMLQGLEQHSDLLILRAKILFSRGSVDDSIKHLRNMLAGDPDNKRAVSLLKQLRVVTKRKEKADVAYKSRDYRDALALYNETLTLCPEDSSTYMAKLYFNRASTHAALGQHEKSMADCSEAIQLDSDYIKAYMRRAASALLVEGGDRRTCCEQAVHDYEAALELSKQPGQSRDIVKKLRAATIELNKARRKDLYKILGLTRHASQADIKKAYRKKALTWHPDRHSSSTGNEKEKAETMFRDINLAYEVLSDPVKRSGYDDGYANKDCMEDPASDEGGTGVYGPAAGGSASGIDPNVLFEMYMNQRSST